MSLFLTLFGGMTFTALLYGLFRFVRLSNFWAAVFAAGLLDLAYLVFAFGTAPSLDRVTMHLIAYPTIAVLLFQLYNSRTRVHWVPLLLVGMFAGLSVLMGTFVYIASEGVPPAVAAWLLPNADKNAVYTGFSGVVAHHDEAAKSIGAHRNMEAQLEQRGWQVEVAGLGTLQQARGASLRVTLKAAGKVPLHDVDVSIELARPGQAAEQHFALHPAATTDAREAVFLAEVPTLAAGMWVSALKITAPRQRMIVLEQAFEIKTTVP